MILVLQNCCNFVLLHAIQLILYIFFGHLKKCKCWYSYIWSLYIQLGQVCSSGHLYSCLLLSACFISYEERFIEQSYCDLDLCISPFGAIKFWFMYFEGILLHAHKLFCLIFIYLFLAALCLLCYTRTFSSFGEWELVFIVVHRLLIVGASLAEHGL